MCTRLGLPLVAAPEDAVHGPAEEAVSPHALHPQRIHRLGSHGAARLADNLPDVDLVHDPLDESGQVDASDHAVDIDADDGSVKVDPGRESIDVDTLGDLVEVEAVNDPVH